MPAARARGGGGGGGGGVGGGGGKTQRFATSREVRNAGAGRRIDRAQAGEKRQSSWPSCPHHLARKPARKTSFFARVGRACENTARGRTETYEHSAHARARTQLRHGTLSRNVPRAAELSVENDAHLHACLHHVGRGPALLELLGVVRLLRRQPARRPGARGCGQGHGHARVRGGEPSGPARGSSAHGAGRAGANLCPRAGCGWACAAATPAACRARWRWRRVCPRRGRALAPPASSRPLAPRARQAPRTRPGCVSPGARSRHRPVEPTRPGSTGADPAGFRRPVPRTGARTPRERAQDTLSLHHSDSEPLDEHPRT